MKNEYRRYQELTIEAERARETAMEVLKNKLFDSVTVVAHFHYDDKIVITAWRGNTNKKYEYEFDVDADYELMAKTINKDFS